MFSKSDVYFQKHMKCKHFKNLLMLFFFVFLFVLFFFGFQKVQTAIDQANTEPRVKALLETLKDYPNIPRKKTKFEVLIVLHI